MKVLNIIIIFFVIISNIHSEVRKIPQQYSSIQFAIDAASDGDTILIGNGKYYEYLNIKKSLYIIGLHKDSVSIESPSESSPPTISNCIVIDSARQVKLSNLRISGNTYPYFRAGGNCIKISNSSDITLESIEAIAGKGSNALCGLQMSSPAYNGGNSIDVNNSQNLIIDKSKLIGGKAGGTNINDSHCDPHIASNGYSVIAINNSQVKILDPIESNIVYKDNSSIIDIITSLKDNKNREIRFLYKLKQNYPNPFNNSTKIDFEIFSDKHVELGIYNMLGKEIDILINEYLSAGNYSVNWKAENIPSGIYLYRLRVANLSQIKSMILLK